MRSGDNTRQKIEEGNERKFDDADGRYSVEYQWMN